jgi:hypothetical protein
MATLSPSAALPEMTALPGSTSIEVEAAGTDEVSQLPALNQSLFPAAPVQTVCAKAGYPLPAVKQTTRTIGGRRR